jgi:hypothetical protein
VNRARNSRPRGIGAATRRRRSSDKKNVESEATAERKETEERQEKPRQSEAKQVVAKFFECGQLRRQPVGANEEGTADAEPDASKDARSE